MKIVPRPLKMSMIHNLPFGEHDGVHKGLIRFYHEQDIRNAIQWLVQEHQKWLEEETDCIDAYERGCVIASKRHWLGTEEQRQKAIKEHKERIKKNLCKTCYLISKAFGGKE